MSPRRMAAAVALASLSACGLAPGPCPRSLVRSGVSLTCPVPEWTDRAFDLVLPPAWDGTSALPVVFVFHGGGGNRTAAARTSCPDGQLSNPRCVQNAAAAAGFAVVMPDGTGARPLHNVRTWNAGGGTRGFNCASGPACHEGVDDMAYLDALLAEVRRLIPVDPARVHATGLSNGGAITQRWACERPTLLASIAPVGSANQFAETGGRCAGGVPVLHVHGTSDPCWTYAASAMSCLEGDDAGVKIGVETSLQGWRTRNGCSEMSDTTELADTDPRDGTRTTLTAWRGCTADVAHLRIEGGGHTWPGGYQYLGEDRIGRVARDFDGTARILEFFNAHRRR